MKQEGWETEEGFMKPKNDESFCYLYTLKATVRVISCNPPCKDTNVWFSTVPLKALSDQAWIRYTCL